MERAVWSIYAGARPVQATGHRHAEDVFIGNYYHKIAHDNSNGTGPAGS